MSSPGDQPPTQARSGGTAAFRDTYRKAKAPQVSAPKPGASERRPWYKLKGPGT